MKLVIVTVVNQYHKEVLGLFKKANIESFSEASIEGFINIPSNVSNSSWFPIEKSGSKSRLFFSFTEEEEIETLFQLLSEFNSKLESNNPLRAVVIPIEKHLI